MKLKTIIAAIATLSIAFTSCSKDRDDDFNIPPISGLNIIHASPTTEKLDVYVENTRANNTDFAFGNKMGYFSLYSGSRRLVTTKKGSTETLLAEDLVLEDQKAYSLFIYDKFDALKYLLVKDDLTAPSSGKAKVRFVHLSPDAAALNLAIQGEDTDLFTDKSFKGYTDFVEITPAEKVTFVIKNKADGSVAATLDNVKIEGNKIYTVWAKGLAAATDNTGLGVEVFEHR